MITVSSLILMAGLFTPVEARRRHRERPPQDVQRELLDNTTVFQPEFGVDSCLNNAEMGVADEYEMFKRLCEENGGTASAGPVQTTYDETAGTCTGTIEAQCTPPSSGCRRKD